MKISFVIPAYNEENYIGNCLNSILGEIKNKNLNIEIIVVNNASTDRTKEIASSFKNVKVIDEPRKSLARARHAGFLAATGDLIANIDSDTMLTPGWIEKTLSEFRKDPNLVALSGPLIYYDLSSLVNLGTHLFYRLGYLTYILNNFILGIGSMLQGGNFIVRRKALKKINGYDLRFDFYGEDTNIACRLYPLGNVKFTFKLPIYSSGRRLKAEGVLTMAIRYSLNYLWTIIFGKPFSKNYIDIRH